MFVIEAGALGDGAGLSLQGHEPDGVELVGEVAPGVAGGDLAGADEQQRQPAQLHVGDDAVAAAVVDRAQVELLEIFETNIRRLAALCSHARCRPHPG